MNTQKKSEQLNARIKIFEQKNSFEEEEQICGHRGRKYITSQIKYSSVWH